MTNPNVLELRLMPPPPLFFHVQNISAMAGSHISIRHASCHVSLQSQIWLLNRPSESQAACRRRGPFVRISLALVGHSLQHLGLSGHYSPVTRVRLEKQDISMCENPSKYNWIGITSCTSLFWNSVTQLFGEHNDWLKWVSVLFWAVYTDWWAVGA